jgi:hypothetical protein
VLVTPNLRLLSAVVLCFIPLLRPFVWQFSILPALPTRLFPMLNSPFPLICGSCGAMCARACDCGLIRCDVVERQEADSEEPGAARVGIARGHVACRTDIVDSDRQIVVDTLDVCHGFAHVNARAHVKQRSHCCCVEHDTAQCAEVIAHTKHIDGDDVHIHQHADAL